MSHVRQLVRDAVVGLLTGATDAGTEVHTARVYPVGTLPSIDVNTPNSENADADIGTMDRQGMRITLSIEIRATSTASVVDALDDIEAQVTAALRADPTLGIGCFDTQWMGSDTDLDESHEKPIGVQVVRYETMLRTLLTAHEQIG